MLNHKKMINKPVYTVDDSYTVLQKLNELERKIDALPDNLPALEEIKKEIIDIKKDIVKINSNDIFDLRIKTI